MLRVWQLMNCSQFRMVHTSRLRTYINIENFINPRPHFITRDCPYMQFTTIRDFFSAYEEHRGTCLFMVNAFAVTSAKRECRGFKSSHG